jgi:hypothetical protein
MAITPVKDGSLGRIDRGKSRIFRFWAQTGRNAREIEGEVG